MGQLELVFEFACFGLFVMVAVVGALSGIGASSAGKAEQDSLAKLSECQCPACGELYGTKAASDASEKYSADCQEAQRQYPGCMLNFVREWTVECLHCKTKSYFNYQTNLLNSEPMLKPSE